MTQYAGNTTTRAITTSYQVQALFRVTHRRAGMYYTLEEIDIQVQEGTQTTSETVSDVVGGNYRICEDLERTGYC